VFCESTVSDEGQRARWPRKARPFRRVLPWIAFRPPMCPGPILLGLQRHNAEDALNALAGVDPRKAILSEPAPSERISVATSASTISKNGNRCAPDVSLQFSSSLCRAGGH